MSDDEYDEDLKRAIALSLQESSPPPRGNENTVIDLISEDEDEDDDLNAPLTTKIVPTNSAQAKPVQNETEHYSVEPDYRMSEDIESRSMNALAITTAMPSIPTDEFSLKPCSSLGLLGLDRKQMEEERLARLNVPKPGVRDCEAAASTKRKAELVFRDNTNSRNVKAKAPTDNVIHKAQPTTSALASQALNDNNSHASSSGIRYPHGIVKKTWAFGYARDESDIKIEEVLQKDSLELAVLSAFQIDTEWIVSKLDSKTKVVWVLQAKSEAEKENWRDAAPKKYRFCFPFSEHGIPYSISSSIAMFEFPNKFRPLLEEDSALDLKALLISDSGRGCKLIVVPSANLVPYDWGETGVMENVCFLIDLPRLPSGEVTEPKTQFGIELAYFLVALGLDRKIVDSLKNFDFSRTAELAFVHSIGGSHDSTWQRTGYCGLGQAVQSLGFATDNALTIDFLAASLGNLNEEFIKAMYLACQGDDGLIQYRLRTTKSTRGKGAESKRELSDDILSRCRVYFPTEQTVSESKGGGEAGGTICLQEKFYDSKTFPRELMRDCVSKRQGLLIHSKMIFVRGPRAALAYIGSANLSEAAWGKLVKNGRGGTPKLNCRNWECGVLLPVRPVKSSGTEDVKQEALGMEVFDGLVPVPMLTPGKPYRVRKPWYFRQH